MIVFCLKFFALLVAVLAVALPIFISEMIEGWTRKYSTQPFHVSTHIPDMSGKVVIVTGANTGIGYESALELTRNGAHVIVCARSESKGEG